MAENLDIVYMQEQCCQCRGQFQASIQIIWLFASYELNLGVIHGTERECRVTPGTV